MDASESLNLINSLRFTLLVIDSILKFIFMVV
jgi:hypothetical protein